VNAIKQLGCAPSRQFSQYIAYGESPTFFPRLRSIFQNGMDQLDGLTNTEKLAEALRPPLRFSSSLLMHNIH
jgi:hypothetical protein